MWSRRQPLPRILPRDWQTSCRTGRDQLALVGSSPESLGLTGLLPPGPWDTDTLLHLPSEGGCQKQAQLRCPAQSFVPRPARFLQRRLKDSSFSPISSVLPPLLCFLELQPIALRGGGRRNLGTQTFLQYTALLPSPLTPTFLVPFSLVNAWRQVN